MKAGSRTSSARSGQLVSTGQPSLVSCSPQITSPSTLKVLGFGLDLSGNPLFKPVDGTTFEQALIDGLARNAKHLQRSTKATSAAFTFRGEVQRRVLDLGDPHAAGWSFLVDRRDPQRRDIEAILEPLAHDRGMTDLRSPLLFNGEPQEEWFDWLHDSYFALEIEGKKTPQYVLIVGGPERVPFQLQSLLQTVASVGRVAFDHLDDLRQYVDKLLRLEKAAEPTVTREAFFFAPDGGLNDPTHFSRQYMTSPMADHVEKDLKFKVQKRFGDEATKPNLLDGLRGHAPSLVYFASHGLGATNEPLEAQKRYNGAICCQHSGRLSLDALFTGDDVPKDEPFLEGAVFFQFACFGYGTPAESDYSHWLDDVPKAYASTDFVANLPKQLLAHPRGPIAYVGHLDTAFLHAFADPEAPETLERWNNRIAPFVKAVDQLLAVQPSGLAMEGMGERFSLCNTLITSTYDRDRRGKLKWTPELRARFLDTWITRSDAQNYMVFGDPAARLRIPSE